MFAPVKQISVLKLFIDTNDILKSTCTGWLPVVVILNNIFCVVVKLTLKIANLFVLNFI